MRLPILRDRVIDPARTAVQKNQIGVALAEPDIAQVRLRFMRVAGRSFWNWVAAARSYYIASQLLDIAQKRDGYLRGRLKAGAVASIEIVDNQRTIVDRRTRLLLFRRSFEQASIDLSLFLRDEQGKPVRPDWHWRAPDFPQPRQHASNQLASDVETAFQNRPELNVFQLKRQQLQLELALASNQLLPNVDIVLQGAQDFGPGKKTLDRSAYEAGVLVEVPLQRRFARGKTLAIRGKLAMLSASENFMRDQIAAQVQDALSALLRYYTTKCST